MKFLIDANLPYYFSIWNQDNFIHLKDLDDEWKDEQVWDHAKQNNLTIISKDSDFSNRIMVSDPPPKVIHIRFGNLKLKEFHKVITALWPTIEKMSEAHKLVNVYKEMVSGID